MSKALREKITKLESMTKSAGAKVSKGALGGMLKNCMNVTTIIAIVTPVAVFLVFYFFTPSFMKREEDDELVKDKKKIMMWTGIITVVFWGGLYGYSYFMGHKTGKVCTA